MRSGRIADAATLGLVLREARMRSGLTQRQMADRLGVNQSYIAELEIGKPTKAIERLLDFAREAGVALYLEGDDA